MTKDQSSKASEMLRKGAELLTQLGSEDTAPPLQKQAGVRKVTLDMDELRGLIHGR